MPTITIAKKLKTHKNLIAVPHRVYKKFLMWQKKIKSTKTFKPSLAEKKALVRARKEFAEGKYVTLAQLKHELELDC